RMRPLFEEGTGLIGNKATHAAAVQLVRGVVTGISAMFPTDQWDAGIAYFTEPTKGMSSSDQFESMTKFQAFLNNEFIGALANAADKTKILLEKNPTGIYAWDNKVVYGTGAFVDGANRYVGYGPAEVAFSAAVLYRAAHSAMIFCAYNQDAI